MIVLLQKDLQQVWLKTDACLIRHDLAGQVIGEGFFIRPFTQQCVKHIGNRCDAGLKWNGFTGQSFQVTVTIPFFVVIEDDPLGNGIDFIIGDHLMTYGYMLFHCGILLFIEPARFPENIL